jgi:16S rRNA pseudouridine516 synthase
MFAAAGNHVDALQRIAVGALQLDELPAGEWRMLSETDVAKVFAGTPVA